MKKNELLPIKQKKNSIKFVSTVASSTSYRTESSEVEHKITFPLVDSSYDNQEIISCIDTLLSGQMTMGKKVRRFEEDFAGYLHATYSIVRKEEKWENSSVIISFTLISSVSLKIASSQLPKLSLTISTNSPAGI